MNGSSLSSDPLAVLSALGLLVSAALLPLLYGRWNGLRKALRAAGAPAPSRAETRAGLPVETEPPLAVLPPGSDPTGLSLTDLSLAVERLSRAQEARLDAVEKRLAAIEALLASRER